MKTNLDFNSLEVKRKINLLAEICRYGIEWNNQTPYDYMIGGVETVAHTIACCIVQWFGFESCGTGETRDALKMEQAVNQNVSIEEWEKRITEYLKMGVDGQQN